MDAEEKAEILAVIDGLLTAVVIALEHGPDPIGVIRSLRETEESLRKLNTRSETIDALRRVRKTFVLRAGGPDPL